MRKTAAVILVFTLFAGCAHSSRSISGLNSGNATTESEIGEAIHREILHSIPVCRNQKFNDYVEDIGEKIALAAGRKDLRYQFVLLEDDRIYATHAPGGHVYLTTGFFEFLASEIELAAVMAHEIGALQYRDPRLSGLKQTVDLVLRTGSMAAPAFGSIGVLALLGVSAVDVLVNRGRSIEQETVKADDKALRYMVDSGFDPQGLLDLVKRLDDPTVPERPYLYDYLRSHPVSDKRIERLNKAFASLNLENKEFRTKYATFLEVKQALQQTFPRRDK